jgi:hypothetical protein
VRARSSGRPVRRGPSRTMVSRIGGKHAVDQPGVGWPRPRGPRARPWALRRSAHVGLARPEEMAGGDGRSCQARRTARSCPNCFIQLPAIGTGRLRLGPSVSPAYGRAGLRHAGMSTRTRYCTQTTSPSASRLNASSTRRSMPGWPFSFLYKKSRPNSRTAASDCWRVSAPCQQLPDRPAFAADLTSLTSLNCHGCLPSDEDTMSGLASSRSNSRQMSRLGISLR